MGTMVLIRQSGKRCTILELNKMGQYNPKLLEVDQDASFYYMVKTQNYVMRQNCTVTAMFEIVLSNSQGL